MSETVFRERAIKAYLEPDARGSVLNIAPPAITRMLVVLGVVFAAAIGAAAVTRVQVTASGRGMLRPLGGVVVVRAPTPGVVRSVEVVEGQRIEVGATLARLGAAVTAPVSGVVDALGVRAGDVVGVGQALAKIVPTDPKLVGYLVMPSRYRAGLVVGQHVRLSFEEYPWAEMGFGEGHIERVSEDVMTPGLGAGADRDLRDRQAPQSDSPSAEGSQGFLVEVALDHGPPGAKGPLHNGMSFEGVVPVRKQRLLTVLIRPLTLLLGD